MFLATKVDENCRRTKEIIVACCRVAQKKPSLLVDEQSKDYWRWRDTILFNEDILLEAMCFDLTIEHPHRLVFDMLKHHGLEHRKGLRTAAWAYLNDAVMTQLCVLFTSRTIAASALYCAARHTSTRIPDDERGRPWWEVQHVKLREIRRACIYMAAIYEHNPQKQGPENIYVGLTTPEDEDALLDKTRLRLSDVQSVAPPLELDEQSSEGRRSIEVERRTGDTTDGGSILDEPLAKRRRTEVNGARENGVKHEPRIDEASEEGELDE